MRVVLDTSVLVAAIRSQTGTAKALVENVLRSRLELLISTPLVLEYEAVLTRREHLHASGLTRNEVDSLIDMLCSVGLEVSMFRKVRPKLSDPDDEMVLETAVNGHADAIVTFNVSDFAGVAEDFHIEVLTPREALQRMDIR
ncbi:MAG: putative toxin-antitoxin system toxin component, PIN family [Terracidiphilus sp.]